VNYSFNALLYNDFQLHFILQYVYLTLKVIESQMQHSQQLKGDQAIKQSLWDLCDLISIQDPEDKHRYNANRKP